MKEKNNMIYFNGEELLKYRKQKGLSQEELAEKIGVSSMTISNWMKNDEGWTLSISYKAYQTKKR